MKNHLLLFLKRYLLLIIGPPGGLLAAIIFTGELLALKYDKPFAAFGGLNLYIGAVVSGLAIQESASHLERPSRSIMILGSIPAFAASILAVYLKLSDRPYFPMSYWDVILIVALGVITGCALLVPSGLPKYLRCLIVLNLFAIATEIFRPLSNVRNFIVLLVFLLIVVRTMVSTIRSTSPRSY